VEGCIRAEAYHHDWLLASCYWPLATDFKILGMNRGLGNLGDYKRKLTTPDQGQETSSQRLAASSQLPVASDQKPGASDQKPGASDQKQGASSQERNATLGMALLYAVTFDFFH
jgi:hypothetical protein